MYKTFRLSKIIYLLAAWLLIFTIPVPIVLSALESKTSDGIQLPVIMYHSILKSRQNAYIVSPEQLEEDLKYLSDNHFTTVTVSNLIEYVFYDGALPEKPVMLTFDDGSLNNLTYAVPLLRQYGMRAVISVVGSYTDQEEERERNPAYSYLNWQEIGELISEGIVEIQCHSYDLHSNTNGRRGANISKGENKAAYEKRMTEDIRQFKDAITSHTGYCPAAYTYPFGYYSESSEEVVRQEGFLCSFTCAEKLSIITRDPESLYRIGRFNRPAGLSTEAYFKKLLKEYAQQE